ncbi:MAG TPA: [FeFe] hydrogenase H-cluster maturation GTPase HydF [Clostridia bacterium]|nr:[FeFe] hydrogenase H-cluster maturation GTPase HydF [Clostridia bacterium]HHY06739.1 [FeFe] hydrogenase H-cluster maturation GTPase HydF [Clostridia bacterium]
MNSLQATPRANRLHIALFGITNAGKSSLINALTGQEISLVSKVKGTTTDPVYKAMELAPLGPIVFIDTAGLDDQSELGALRKRKTLEVLNKTDIAILVCDATVGITDFEHQVLGWLHEKKTPFVAVVNKIDLITKAEKKLVEYTQKLGVKLLGVSTSTGKGLKELKEALIRIVPEDEVELQIVGDLIKPGDIVVLVIPLDESAPKGRLILPQQQTLRDLLDNNAVGVVTQPTQLKVILDNLQKKPRLVVTDSQVFHEVAEETPQDVWLTSFSILFARQKGDLKELVQGAQAIEKLQDEDKILIAEACTHHRQADDIGTVKIPHWLRQKTGKKLVFEYSSGYSFPDDLQDYALIIHCAGCMLNRKAMFYRIGEVQDAGVPIVNYGVLIAYVHGILQRALQPFGY